MQQANAKANDITGRDVKEFSAKEIPDAVGAV